ncbi:MAG: endopeptidase La [Planctomycetes bacterium]|nr:endopeptidase La [Planctomycetota bacterium]MCL4730846.1 endopeptidase La [Planctomycetota bacterium]
MQQAVPNQLPLLPLVSVVVFPYNVASFSVHRKPNINLLNSNNLADNVICLAAQKDQQLEVISGLSDLYEIGVSGRVIHKMNLPDGTMQAAVQGLTRVRIKKVTAFEPHYMAEVTPARATTAGEDTPQVHQKIVEALEKFEILVNLDQNYSAELVQVLKMNIKGPGRFADLLATYMSLPFKTKAEILCELDSKKRLDFVIRLLDEEIARQTVDREVRQRTQIAIEKSQREYLLRQQLKAIRNELGEEGGAEAEVEKLRAKLEEARLPEHAAKECRAEIDRLSLISEASAEYNVVHTHIDWLLSIPWHATTRDNLDLKRVRRVLDKDHFGLEKVKDRIIEFLAVLKLKKELKGPILCLVGPPGVGKTSLGRSVARAMGRKFERISLGGLSDDSEIMGHRRTYVGAMPGRIIQSLKKAGSANPILMLDEIDKLGRDMRGDPGAALLEVLDPEQNHAFVDRYIDVAVDLSKVLFICTANVLDTIPGPLRDRMEVIQLSGYTLEEKEQIARTYIIPRQVEAAGLKPDKIRLPNRTVREIVRGYTREAGLRNFERRVAAICRKIATRVAAGEISSDTVVEVTPDQVEHYLGQRLWLPEGPTRKPEVGVVTGLAWTAMGGDTLLIESARYKGTGQVKVTGSLGDVMKESVTTALSYVRSHSAEWGIDPEEFARWDLHLHFPEGAVPKDGPSAGVTITTALISLFTGRPVRGDVAMTGEVTLRGKVLPVGGIKEKVLAAYRSGVRHVLLPKQNEKDLQDVPKEARKAVKITLTEDVSENVKAAMAGKPRPVKR